MRWRNYFGWRSKVGDKALRYVNLGSGEGLFLAFPVGWVGTRLPQEPHAREDYDVMSPEFVVTLLDTSDGKEYTSKFWQHYDPWGGNGEGNTWVHSTMVQEQYCPCHRKVDAAGAGADTDDECEGERFVVKSLVSRAWPKLVLYSETMTLEELESGLTEGLNTPGDV